MIEQIKLLIAEDEAPIRASFVRQLEQAWPSAKLVAVCGDGLSAIEAAQQHQPHVAFLDIRMPGKSGLEVAQEIGQNTFIVFTTAYEEYAISAFESGAIDYLLKPIESTRLSNTVERLKERLDTQKPQSLGLILEDLQAKLSNKREQLKWVTASAGDTVKMISIDDIVYFQSDSKYTKVVTHKDEAVIRTPLKDLKARLDPDQFWQVHRSAIVAADAIESIKKDKLGNGVLRLRGLAQRLPVSKEFQRKLKAL